MEIASEEAQSKFSGGVKNATWDLVYDGDGRQGTGASVTRVPFLAVLVSCPEARGKLIVRVSIHGEEVAVLSGLPDLDKIRQIFIERVGPILWDGEAWPSAGKVIASGLAEEPLTFRRRAGLGTGLSGGQ